MRLMVMFSGQPTTSLLYKLAVHRAIFALNYVIRILTLLPMMSQKLVTMPI